MGYASLDAALAFPNNLAPINSHIAITDTLKSDANFLVHHFVVNQLKNDKHVVLVGLAQIFNHYFLIGRKLGINLQTYKQSGKFVFLDGLTHLNEYTSETPYPPPKAPTAPTNTLDHKDEKQNLLRSFYKTIAQYVTSSNTLVILDDVSVLLYNGFEIEQVSTFILKLRSLVENVQGTLLTVVHADEEGSEDTEQDNFIKSIIYGSNLVLQVQPLNSGLARDVHGQLDIIFGPQQQHQQNTNTPQQSLHYKILDNNVHFFARGVAQV
ncbi:unnamed protein product [Mucor circinelloides]|uniref:Elongator complex protein 6 n=1 Tax=Mucor circinelloides f. circinelloides (strain 1006PhL) TaxID=1220926 RepID=S2K865_MUCC1|nr:hypothetical protein HMPREF1544_01525 [Mucor circinelloides 1006PhL]KAG1111321.1 hypothetical protein G6F42_015064 [Rhizopus arrhizus]